MNKLAFVFAFILVLGVAHAMSGSLSPAVATISGGGSVTLVSSVSGGVPPYTYTWYSGTSAVCSSDTTVVYGPGSADAYSVSPATETYYCVLIKDSSSSHITTEAGPALVNVLVGGSISPSTAPIKSGGSVTLTVNPSGGSGVYTYQWFSGSNPVCDLETAIPGETSSTYLASPSSATYYCVQITDSAHITNNALIGSALVFYPGGVITSFFTLRLWMPLIAISILIGMFIAAIIYMLGFIVDDSRVKARGIMEFGQSVGTAVLAVIIIIMVVFVGNLISSNVLNSHIGTSAGNICVGLENSNFWLTENVSGVEPTNTICGIISGARLTSTDPTNSIDYGLASSYVIIANLTDQTVNNLNGLYVFDNMIGFLGSLTATAGIKFPGLPCLIPLTPECDSVQVSFTPYAGYGFAKYILKPLTTQAEFIFYMYVIQLLLLFITFFMWPYLLAAGIILRATSYTRPAGGLLMAAALALVIVLPLIMIIEYASLGQVAPSTSLPIGGNVVPIGANILNISSSIVNAKIPGTSTVIAYNSLSPNFYVFPSVPAVVNYNGCWPTGVLGIGDGDLGAEEAKDTATASLLGLVYAVSIVGGFPGAIPQVTGVGCSPSGVINTMTSLANVYGIMSVAGFILPLLNVMILIAAMRNLSFLFGGDLDIAGLGKLV